MKLTAISLWQPWASALFALRPDGFPLKPEETRHWEFPQRLIGQEVAIHAAKRETRNEREFWKESVLDSPHRELFANAFAPIGISQWSDLPRGCLIGTIVFAACRPTTGFMDVEEITREWGNYAPKRFAWPTVKRTLLPTPIPCVGRQGFFTVEIPAQLQPSHDCQSTQGLLFQNC